jgi:hypothetical protein
LFSHPGLSQSLQVVAASPISPASGRAKGDFGMLAPQTPAL